MGDEEGSSMPAVTTGIRAEEENSSPVPWGKLISLVVLLGSRTWKTGHHSISSSYYKTQMFSQRDVD